MEPRILDKNFELLAIVDTFQSFIWTERYYQYGDFELYMYYDEKILPYLVTGNYISLIDSDKLMIIENVLLEFDPQEGGLITITGRSLESILTRRVIWDETIIDGDFQTGIKKLITDNIISPSIASRKIENFDFIDSDDKEIINRSMENYYFGENLYDVIHSSCSHRQIGIKVWVDFSTKRFKFQMYKGVDYSYNQDERPWVVFSPEFDNLGNSKYEVGDANYANASLVIGEETFYIENDDGTTTEYPQMKLDISLDASSGLNRREIFVDASSITRDTTNDDGESVIIPSKEYQKLLQTQAKEELEEYKSVEKVDGKVETTKQFVYGKDFKMGDIIQVVNEFGMKIPSRITEVIRSYNNEGYQVIPTLVSLKSETEEE